MKRVGLGFTIAVGVLCLSQQSLAQSDVSSPPSPPRAAAAVNAAPRIKLMVLREVNSSQAKAGDIVKLMVDEPFQTEGVTIPAGSPAFGIVREAKDAGAGLKRGRLEVQLTYIAVGDRQLPLTGELLDKGEGGKGDDAAKVLLAPIYILFARGNVAKLRAGEIVYGQLAPQPNS
ncbi:hypothetical protein BH11PSE5_BH11PSE5_21030 [soil metagenome]